MAAGLALLGVFAVTASAAATTAYRVRPGDSLSAIAYAHGTSVGALARLNGLSPDSVLLAGSTLRLPGPTVALQNYRVHTGDTGRGSVLRISFTSSSSMHGSGSD